MTDKILEVRGLTKTYGGVKKRGAKKADPTLDVLKGIDLDIYRGDVVCLIGPSGCGKSTFLRCLNRLETPTSGSIKFEGVEVNETHIDAVRQKMGMVFQHFNLFPHLTVKKNLELAPSLLKLKDKEAISARADELLARVGLADKANAYPKSLSGGQQQRIAIARALVNEPSVLLLDEPLGALDLKLRKEMQQELKYIQQEVGITFIFVTHDQEEALTMSDKIVVMNAGEIQQIGTPTEIYRNPVNEFVAKFIGETNIIDGVMLEDDLVMFEDKKYACRARGYNKNEKVDVVIRPEHLDIVPRAEGMLKGTVKSQLFKGMHYETVVETRVGTSITVKMQVSQDRPVYNEEKGEKISANAFLLDVEDVEELDDAKVVALASAEAWDAETEEPISIKTVEYDIKPEVGSYSVTFTTAAGTSITVKAAVMAENRVESKVYQEEIYAMNFFKKVEDIQESIALDTDLETWASASAWSLEDGEQVEITDVKYDFDPETIEPGVYDVTFSTEGYEYKVSTTHAFEEGEQVGLVFRPEDIHVMKKERTCNTFEGKLVDETHVDFLGCNFECLPVQGIEPGSAVQVEVDFQHVILEDNEEDGRLTGEVKFILYKGNHYHLTVFTDWDEDIFVDTNDVWDDGDRVGITIAPQNIRIVQSLNKEGSAQ